MAVDIHEMVNPEGFEGIQESSTDEEPAAALPASEIIQRVNEILGYDIFEAELMVEGYIELGTEMLSIAERSFSAQAETLPPE